MKRYLSYAGLVVVASATVWSTVAAYLSAHQLIDTITELAGYSLCLMAVFGGEAIYCLFHPGGPLRNGRLLLSALLLIAPLIIVSFFWYNSTKLFVFWKMKAVPAAAWRQMAAEVDLQARQVAKGSPPYDISREALPKSFAPLGRIRECRWVNVIGEGDNYVGVQVSYGGRGRRWGLVVGPMSPLKYPYLLKVKQIPVATNAIFFVGHD
jgi:hypothetical protein